MERQASFTTNGREAYLTDMQTLAEAGALADDRVLAELFRMLPFDGATIAKGILPPADRPLVEPVGSPDRSLIVNAHRALVGSRAAESDDAKKNWRDIRSCVSVGTTTRGQVVTLAANASGNSRWDLIYEVVAVDTALGDTRFFKDPTTKAVSAASFEVARVTTPQLQAVTGTPGATPAKPSLPPDADPNYNVPIAYVLVRNGATSFAEMDIIDIAPALTISPAAGAVSMRPASAVSELTGASLGTVDWTPVAASRPGMWMPPSMVGGVSLLIPVQLGSSLTASLADGDIVDDKIDWRKRFFRWTASIFPGSFDLIASDPALASGFYDGVPSTGTTGGMFHGANLTYGMGASFSRPFTNNFSGQLDIMFLSNSVVSNFGTGTFGLYVDMTTGALKAYINGTVNAQIFIWLEATAFFPNASTL